MTLKRTKAAVVVFFVILALSGCAKFEQKLFDWVLSIERQRSDLVLRTLSLDGQNLWYLEREGQGETILLLHGFGANKDTWVRFVRYLPKHYRILAIDMAGHGDSRRHMELSYDARHLTEGFSQAVKSLGLDRFHLVGNSLGGYVATLYAAENPQKLITLGLFASAGVLAPTPSEFQMAFEKGDNPLIVNSTESFDHLMKAVFYEKPFVPWPVRPVLVRDLIQRHKFSQKMWHDLWENRKDVVELLPQIRMPVFLLWGDKDRILHVSSVEVYQRHLPDVTTKIIKNCGHGLILEKPKEAAGAYTKFLQNLKTRK